MIVDYLKKCINHVSKSTKAKEADEDMDEDIQEDEDKKEVKKRKNTDVISLRRPIIFICNDMYAKALIPLREIALSIKIGESSPDRLRSRLRYICK